MGIYDRDYYHERRPSFGMAGPPSMVVILIVVNVVLYLGNALIGDKEARGPAGFAAKVEGLNHDKDPLSYALAAKVTSLIHPWQWFQLLTYGFVHDPRPSHIIFNMLGLWFLGRELERDYGRKEFLSLYLAMILAGSLVWTIVGLVQGFPASAPMYGASGAVAGIVTLFALRYPHRTILLFFVLPVPAWVAGVLLVGMDILGATGGMGTTHVAYTVHLAGAAFAFLYFRLGWRITRLGDGWSSLWSRLRPRPKLRVHDPRSDEEQLSAEVDRILEKIHREGEEHLTRKERRTLEAASREYQKRRRAQ